MTAARWSLTKSVSSPAPVGRRGLLQRKCACGGTPEPTGECAACRKKRLVSRGVQTKLVVSTPGDRHEREADRLAQRIVRGGVADGPLPVTPVRAAVGQRSSGPSAEPSGGAPGQAARAVAGGGRPLSTAERGYFEPRLGHDLSAVRIHSDASAGAAARGIQARAFTLGSHVAFAPGQYRPGSESGRRLLAHELVHTVQQAGGIARAATIQRSCDHEESWYQSASNFCRDDTWSPITHSGKTCYREITTPTADDACPPGIHVCFDENGGCESSPDQASLADSKDDDGSCSWRKWCVFEHTLIDVIPAVVGPVIKQMGRAQMDCTRICSEMPWYLRGFCLSGCTPGFR